ncbi:hypothetical protein EYF80_061411 [Liparis tanakae]|uniref:Uncharacterized protein n=1 Tax=Liparis tanakae TaxID=230148 RepID=A0A4Z2EI71_9TELE|nr:hypothetical protein EYF80_061411 [Liparis tanakae]
MGSSHVASGDSHWDRASTEKGGAQGMTSRAPMVSSTPLCRPHSTSTTMTHRNLARRPKPGRAPLVAL